MDRHPISATESATARQSPVREHPRTETAGPAVGIQRVRGLQVSAGNGAVVRMLQRQPQRAVQRAPSAADVARMTAVESKLDGVSAAANAQSVRLNEISDGCILSVKDAQKHLTTSSKQYKAGHKLFTDVLARADKEYEFDKAVEDSIQGILVAAALAVVAPEALLVSAGLKAMASSTSSAVATMGLAGMVGKGVAGAGVRAAEGGLGELGEQAAGAVVDGAKSGDGGRPSDAAAGGGDSAGDRFEEAFGQLTALVAALPQLGAPASAQAQVALGASQLARDATKLRHGESPKFSADDIETKATQLEALKTAGVDAVTKAEAIAARVKVMSEQVIGKPSLDPVAVEDMLWTSFMASLSGDAHNMLDNDVLEDYLGPKGKKLFDFGGYTSDSDTQGAVAAARVKWITEQGLTPGPNPETQYQTQRKLNEIRRSVVGQPGVITGAEVVKVGTREFKYPRNAGALATGTAVTALHAIAPYHYLLGTVLIAEVRDSDIEVLVDVPRAPEPAAPATP